uniref:pentapeptide repeat-containing protein n=1 Tax=Leisingera sp. F5 TaxID=1813816 RepID=UPI000A4CD54B
MRDETEGLASAAPQPKLKPANENPWYVLMTLYGDDHDRNRAVWNAWAGRALTKGERQKLVDDGVIVAADFLDWENIHDEIVSKFDAEFRRRNEPHCSVPNFPDPRHPIRLSKITVEHSLELQRWCFPSSVYISLVCFNGDVDFDDALFLGDLSIRRTVFECGVNFLGASFFGRTSFSATFGDDVSFSISKFYKSIVFHDSEFKGYVSFSRVVFSEDANFIDTIFKRRSSFEMARFQGRARFLDVVFGEPGEVEASFPSFRDCQFENPTSFRQASFLNAYPDFSGAILDDRTTFTAREEPTESEVKANRNLKGAVYWPYQTKQDSEVARETCATIRHILAKQGLPEDEHFFFRREMHFAGKIGSLWQRLPYLLFGLFSEYGYSILRPTLWLLGIWALGFAAFWGYFSGCCVPAPHEVIERPMGSAMALSLSNLFPLFGFGRTFLLEELKALPAVLQFFSGFQ